MTRIALLTATLLAGCAAPSSPPTIAPVPPARLGLSAIAAPPIDSRWWTSFGDPQLDRIVADAAGGNPSLDAALARLAQADAVLSSRRADLGPDATIDASAQVARLSGRYTIPPPYAGSVRFVGQGLGNLNWNLDLFGRQRAAITGARASVAAAGLDLAAARLAIAGSVVETYLDLVRAETQAAIARRTIDARQGSLRLVQVRVRNNLASKLDATAAETLLAQAQAALLAAQGSRALAADALAALAGRGPDYAAAIGASRMNLDAGLPLPAQVPADLLGRRPDLLAGLARIQAAAAGRQVARRAFYPNVNLAANIGLQAIGLGNLVGLDAGTVGAGPALSLPIFDNGRRRADLAGATAALDLATADYNDRVVGAVRDAADAIALTVNLAERRRAQAEVVGGYARTGRLNTIRVNSGLESRLDLVDNDIRLLDAELVQANLVTDAARARVQLVLALGGGFDPAQGARPTEAQR